MILITSTVIPPACKQVNKTSHSIASLCSQNVYQNRAENSEDQLELRFSQERRLPHSCHRVCVSLVYRRNCCCCCFTHCSSNMIQTSSLHREDERRNNQNFQSNNINRSWPTKIISEGGSWSEKKEGREERGREAASRKLLQTQCFLDQ